MTWKIAILALYNLGGTATSNDVRDATGLVQANCDLRTAKNHGMAVSNGRVGANKPSTWTLTDEGRQWCKSPPPPKQRKVSRKPHYSTVGSNVANHVSKARKAKSPLSLRRQLESAKHRVHDAHCIGWPALAQSWQRDVDAIQELLDDFTRVRVLEAA